MFALGKGRVDRDFEQWVLWELPLTRALQYYHAALRYAGEWTVPVDLIGNEEKLEAANRAIEKAVTEDTEESDEFDELF